MNFIVVIHPDGIVQKVDQNEMLYHPLMDQIRALNPTFSPYSDDSNDSFYDVVGSTFHTRFTIASTTTTTTTHGNS